MTTPRPRNRPCGHPAAFLTATLAAIAPAGGAAADFIWDGSDDDLWSTDANWDGGLAPVAGAISDVIIFGPEGGGGNFMVTGADGAYTDILGMSFTGADGAYTVSGTGSFSFADGSFIVNDSAFDQTINVDLIGTGAQLGMNSSTGNLIFGGAIDLSDTGGVELIIVGDFDISISGIVSGAGGSLFKTGAGVLTLTGANTFSGGVVHREGTIVLGDDAALGTGTLSVEAVASIESDNDARNIANQITLDPGTSLTVTGANDLELSGVIDSDGELIKEGTGTLKLSGANTYTGATTIAEGVLQLDGGAAIADTGAVVLADAAGVELEILATETIGSLQGGGGTGGTVNLSGGDLLIAEDGTSVFDGVVTGAGALELSGTGTLQLTGANTYAGGTTVSGVGATLALGDDDALGTGALDLLAESTLAIVGGERTIANDISVQTTDSVTVAGGDAVDFTGAVDLNGNDATFDIANTGGVEFSGVISNGGLTKLGSGDLTLSGVNTYAGDTNVDAGRLLLDGSIAGDAYVSDGGTMVVDGTVGGALFINDGGALSGIGSTVGNVTLGSGGTFDPGNSIGTFTIGGDYDQATGSVLNIEVNALNGSGDLLDVSGVATLSLDSTISVSIASSEFIMGGDTFTIIDADGGVFDGGAIIDTTSASLTFILAVAPAFENGDQFYILEALRSPTAFQDAALTENNAAIGSSLDSLVPIANDDPDGEAADLLGKLDPLDQGELNEAMDQMSPESYNASTLAGINAATAYTTTQMSELAERRNRRTALPPAAEPAPGALASVATDPRIIAAAIAAQDEAPSPLADPAPRFEVFARGIGLWSDEDGGTNKTGYDADTYGVIGGIDYAFSPSFLAGVSLGYTTTEGNLDGGRGDFDIDTFRVGPYFAFDPGNGWFFNTSVTFGIDNYDGKRDMDAIDETAKSDYDGWNVVGYGEIGFAWEPDNVWSITPKGSLQYTYFDFDGFTEDDGHGANLRVDDRDTDSLIGRLGVEVSYRPDRGHSPWLIDGEVGLHYEFLDNDSISARFAVGGTPFSVDTGSRDSSLVYAGAGLSYLLSENFSIGFRYQGWFAGGNTANTILGGVSIRF